MAKQPKLHILVMSVEWQAALACIQSYGRKGHTVSIISNRIAHPNYSSIFVNKMFFLEKQAEARARELMELVDRESVDLVVPISDDDAFVVARAKQLFPDSRALVSASLRSVAIARSRNRTTDLCRQLGIDTPETVFITHENASRAARNLGYPCFLKLSGSVAGLGVFEVSSEADLEARLGMAPREMEMQLQAKIEGDFADITGFALNGRVLESFAFRVGYAHSRSGTPCYSERLKDDRLIQILSKIAGELRWTGAIDLDLLQRKDGGFVLLEINPRFSGTTVFALKVGIDLPAYYISTWMGTDKNEAFRPSRADAERFVSLLEEARYLRGAGQADKVLAERFRSDKKWVDNSFWDDWRYSAALFEHMRRLLLNAK